MSVLKSESQFFYGVGSLSATEEFRHGTYINKEELRVDVKRKIDLHSQWELREKLEAFEWLSFDKRFLLMYSFRNKW